MSDTKDRPMRERTSIRKNKLPGGAVDYLVAFRSERSGLVTRMRFEISEAETLDQDKVGEAMAKAIAEALKAGFEVGMVAARCTPCIPLRPGLESMVSHVLERPVHWRDGYWERALAEDAEDGLVEISV